MLVLIPVFRTRRGIDFNPRKIHAGRMQTVHVPDGMMGACWSDDGRCCPSGSSKVELTADSALDDRGIGIGRPARMRPQDAARYLAALLTDARAAYALVV